MTTITAHTFAPHDLEPSLRSASSSAAIRRAPEAVHRHAHGEPCNERCLRVEPDGTTSQLVPPPPPVRPQLRFPLEPQAVPRSSEDQRLGWGDSTHGQLA